MASNGFQFDYTALSKVERRDAANLLSAVLANKATKAQIVKLGWYMQKSITSWPFAGNPRNPWAWRGLTAAQQAQIAEAMKRWAVVTMVEGNLDIAR